MTRVWALCLMLATPGWSFAADPQAGSETTKTTTKYIEIAGTVVNGKDTRIILNSNGHEFVLSVDPDDPGYRLLKTGLAIIVKGTVTIIDEPGQDRQRSLRPLELIVQGHTFRYPVENLALVPKT